MARRKRKRRAPSLWLVLGLAVLAAGFIARRLLMPSAVHYLTYRAPDSPAPQPQRDEPRAAASAAPDAAQSDGGETQTGGDENPTVSDRRALQEILKRKMK